MLSAFVMVTPLSRVHDKAQEIALDHGLYVALAATYNLDVVALQLATSTLAHVSCKHHLDAHLLHHLGDVRLASATLGRVQSRGCDDTLLLDLVNRVVCAVAEMVVYVAVARRYCNLHNNVVYCIFYNRRGTVRQCRQPLAKLSQFVAITSWG